MNAIAIVIESLGTVEERNYIQQDTIDRKKYEIVLQKKI